MTTTLTEPVACERCGGSGTIDAHSYAIGGHEIRCEGVDDSGNCDDGIVR